MIVYLVFELGLLLYRLALRTYFKYPLGVVRQAEYVSPALGVSLYYALSSAPGTENVMACSMTAQTLMFSIVF